MLPVIASRSCRAPESGRNNVLELARFTGATAFHSSARSSHPINNEVHQPRRWMKTLRPISIDAEEVSELRRLLDLYEQAQLP